jgi:pyruvate formate lyase activating enzyme
MTMKEALLYDPLENGKVLCKLCAHRCTISPGGVGVCRVRENREGVLYTHVYGKTITQNVDPVEKKPLFHFFPGSKAYSIATPGCNFRCAWCQNADISQVTNEGILELGADASPEQIVASAKRQNCRSIAYTYTEPTIFFEYSYDTAREAHENGLFNIYVTNGYMTGEMLDMLHPYLDAANVDLKGFREDVYRKYAGAHLQPVLDSLKKMKAMNIWLEVATLIIPGINDDPDELRDIGAFIAEELGPETPWHVSRFAPAYKMTNVPPTPISTLNQAQEIGYEEGLRYIYIGNIAAGADTNCHICGHLLVSRSMNQIVSNTIVAGGLCPECGTPLAGRGMEGGSG